MQEDRKSIWNKFSMPEARVVELKQERESRAEEHSSLKEEERNLRASKGKSRVSKNGAVKQALQIKGYLEGEEDVIREFFTKLSRMLEIHKVPVGNLEQ
jgi:regulator of replication initiation timing